MFSFNKSAKDVPSLEMPVKISVCVYETLMTHSRTLNTVNKKKKKPCRYHCIIFFIELFELRLGFSVRVAIF